MITVPFAEFSGREEQVSESKVRDELRERVSSDVRPLLATTRNATATLLALLLALQTAAMLTLQNGVFQDEAFYMYEGRWTLAKLLTGATMPEAFGMYTSGSPYGYPILANLLDQVGGLQLARAFSMICALGVTVGVFQAARGLWGDRVGLLSAAVVSTSASLLFVGRLATHDALATLLLAGALAIAMRIGGRPALRGLAVGVLLGAAVLTKYAAAMFGLLLLVAFLVRAFGRGGRAHGLRAVGGLAASASVISATAYLLTRIDDTLVQGVLATTADRQVHGEGDPVWILLHALSLTAVPLVLVAIGTIVILRTRLPWHEKTVSLVLAGAILVAPAYHTLKVEPTSLEKHLAYGLLLAAPVAGFAIARLAPMTRSTRWRSLVVSFAVLALPAAVNVDLARGLYSAWPDPAGELLVLRQVVRPDTSRVLSEEVEVAKYGLTPNPASPQQLTGTDYFEYTDHSGQTLSGLPAYRAAIADGYFDVVAFRNGPGKAVASGVADLLPVRYTLVADLPFSISSGEGSYRVWRLKT
ncbi:ArnT family glycosyltransferase [Propionicimonas sp.]|uniref:ArnT family glycosyltransferase n=1 Tax=Propionicimonas sp. TaxID=1955623 RepID=UPI0039E5F59F